ncbi:MAG: hypothetical protein O7H41_03905 [Planctomycetota bacterium]|nr:hypothetical protein [Planctomycetota bacterium]
MSVFGKSQRYLAVLQKVSDLEMRLETVKTDVDRQSLVHQAVEVNAPDEEIADQIEQRFQAVLQDNIPTLVAEVRKALEQEWDLEAVIGKELFRLLENHLPELTAKELTEEEVASVTEEVSARVRREADGIVEAKLSQLLPLVERENASAIRDEFRPRVDQQGDAIRRLWEDVTRIKTSMRKLTKDMEAALEAAKAEASGGGPNMIPEDMMGRASIESLVNERLQLALDAGGTAQEQRISGVEERITQIAKAFEASDKLLKPKPVRTPKAKRSVRRPFRADTKDKDDEEVLEGILSTKLIVRGR